MKTTAILVFVCLLSYSSFANNPEIELKEIVTAPELDFSTAFEELFENKARLNNASIVEERKIIIIDSDFKKIREESIENIGYIQSINTCSDYISISVHH